MENLGEKSSSFNSRDEQKSGGETPRAPPDSGDIDATDPKEKDAKNDENTQPAADKDGNPSEEKKEDASVEVPEPPPRTLDMVSEDVDHYIETLNNNAEVEEKIPDVIDKFLELVEEKIHVYDSGEVKGKWGEVAEEDSVLLEAVNRISKLLKLQSQLKSSSEEITKRKDSLVNQIGILQHRLMSYFEEEFRFLLEESRYPIDSDPGGHDSKGKQVEQDRSQEPESEVTNSEPEFPGYPENTVTKLKQIAKEMISGGYESECCLIYTICRRHAFEENLHKLGFENMSIDEIQKMQWKTLERDIPMWIQTVKECANVYFSGERKLAESVFAENPSLGVSLFSSFSVNVVMQLLNFAEGVAMTKRAEDKLFKILDMYETLRDVTPNFDQLFPEDIANDVHAETTSSKSRLGETTISIFGDLENAIKTDASKTLVPGGAVHPLTRYIMNYLPFACEYKETLEQVFKEHSKIERADSTSRPRHEVEAKFQKTAETNNNNNTNNNNKDGDQSPFSAQLIRLMSLLDTNLEGKANMYRDVALSCIFMMNNGRYIVQKIKGSPEIYKLVGETWCRKRSSDLRTYHKKYKTEAWSKILNCLNLNGLSVNGKVQKPLLKERFKSFNAAFDEIHKTQSTWIVFDEQLRSELRVSVTSVLIQAYRAFLGRFSQYLDPGRQTDKYIKYQPEDIENLIEDLFDGNAQANAARRKS